MLYKINDNISAFVGLNWTKAYSDYMHIIAGSHQRKVQVGLSAITPIADKTSLFGTVGIGHDLSNYEIGLSQNIASNLELNLSYRDYKIRNMESSYNHSVKVDSEYKGIGYGITYTF